jgi:aryl-alcohol dehydrogenase-like predicted oxidoreductase
VPYSLINREIEKAVIPQALERKIGIIAYSPLQRGLLTGKIKPGHKFNSGDTREGNRFYSDENIKRVNQLLEKLRPIAESHSATLAQIIIHWTLHRPGIACVLVGARNNEQVNDNVKALTITLSSEELMEITKIADGFVLAKPEAV